ncbi:O-antigen ligase family protein [Anaeroselena agilis]|uniref:O-antigen ligase family protein n=1 Tax=Anaeroselena agilis TaxID=3063788 RepID=A0ABU3NZT9_9FIRM|nr:O-antigen ligase family protein [Selenomonadales bacterium 4137-cl]
MRTSYSCAATHYQLNYLTEHCIMAVAFFLPLSFNAASLFLALGALLWVARMATDGHLDLKPTPFDGAVALFVTLAAASILASPDRWVSFYNYYHLMGRYILLYYLVVNNFHTIDQLKRLVQAVLVSAGMVVVYGLYQYVQGVDISAFEWVDGEQFPLLKVRIFSTLENPNLLAGFLVVMAALAAGLGLNAEDRRCKAAFAVLVVALGVCLVLTYSRGAWLSFIAVVAAYGVLYSRKTFWLLLLVPVAVLAGQDVIMERLMSIFNPTDTSATLRIALWESTLAMIADRPLFGIGWAAYPLVYPDYDFFINNPGITIFHAHNMYLHIAAEIGVPGVLAFLALMFGHARLALAMAGSATNRWVGGLMLGVLAAIIGIAVSGFTDYVLYSPQMAMLFWLLNALTVVVYLNSHPTKNSIK